MTDKITVPERKAALDGPATPVLVNTPPDTVFAEGHIPGAINVRSDDILAEAPKRPPDRNAEVIVYCASPRCQRAGKPAARLLSLGYARVRHFEGGKEEWQAAGLSLVPGGPSERRRPADPSRGASGERLRRSAVGARH